MATIFVSRDLPGKEHFGHANFQTCKLLISTSVLFQIRRRETRLWRVSRCTYDTMILPQDGRQDNHFWETWPSIINLVKLALYVNPLPLSESSKTPDWSFVVGVKTLTTSTTHSGLSDSRFPHPGHLSEDSLHFEIDLNRVVRWDRRVEGMARTIMKPWYRRPDAEEVSSRRTWIDFGRFLRVTHIRNQLSSSRSLCH